MNFRKEKKENAPKKQMNIRALKKGSLSVAFTVIFIVAVVLFNVIIGVVANAYPIKIDLTSNRDYTIDFEQEYEDFIKNIDMDVNIVVCAPKSDFTGDTYATQIAYSLGLTDCVNGTLGELTKKYALQTGVFIDTFESMNKNITVSYRNIQSISSFRDITEKFPNEEFEYGDILVYADHTTEAGVKYTRHQILKPTDIFNVVANEEMQGYYNQGYLQEPYYNELESSKLAGEMTSAFYIVTSSESIKSVVVTGHDDSVDTSSLQNILSKNNFSFTEIEKLSTTSIPQDTEFVIIPGPTIDYTETEIKLLSNFLDQGDKNLIYLPTATQPELPRLEEFLIEWGIDIQNSYVLDTQNGYTFAETGDTEYTEKFKDSDITFYPSVYRIIKLTENTDANVETILKSSENSIAYVIGTKEEDFDMNAAEKGPFALSVISTMVNTEGNAESNVLVLSGDTFFSVNDPIYGGAVGVLENSSYANASFLIDLFKSISGSTTEAITIQPKTINELSFAEKITQAPVYKTIVNIVFILLVPVALAVFAVVIFVTRKRK